MGLGRKVEGKSEMQALGMCTTHYGLFFPRINFCNAILSGKECKI